MIQEMEKRLVEDYMASQLQASGWEYVPPDSLQREGIEDPLLVPDLIRAIQRINSELDLCEEELKTVLNDLRMLPTGSNGVRQLLQFYETGVPIKAE
mgnify:CR=1 FL=1